MSDNNKVETKLDDSVTPEMWERARYFADAIGPVPSLFSACVRAIGKVEAVLYPIDTESVRDLAVASAEFLVGTSPTLKSVFYWARAALYPVTSHELGPPTIPRTWTPLKSKMYQICNH